MYHALHFVNGTVQLMEDRRSARERAATFAANVAGQGTLPDRSPAP